MKRIDTQGITYLQPLDGTDQWYYSIDFPDGDMYEAEELHAMGREITGTRLLLIHYPDGEIIEPIKRKKGLCLGRPLFCDGRICFLGVHFKEGIIHVFEYDPQARRLNEPVLLPLREVENCYNLMLHNSPLTLSRQPGNGTFEILWPERKTYSIDVRESFFLREGSRLYFNIWYEDPDYREETIVRDAETGEIIETLKGDLFLMPNGEIWHVG